MPTVGFFRGLTAPFRGGLYVSRQRLWRYLIAPIVMNAALGVVLLVAASRYWHADLAHLLETSPVLGGLLLFVATVLGAAILFILLQPVVSAVFCDRLSEVVEKRVRGSVPAAPFLVSAGRALVHGLLKLVLYGIALVVGLVLTAPLAGIGTLVGLALGAVFLAYDGFDYPLSRRGATFGAKWRYMAAHPALTIGYGVSTTLLYMIPLAMFVAPPIAAVGATLAFLDGETAAEAKAKARAAGAAPPAPTTGADKPAVAAQNSGEKAPEAKNNPIDISAT